MSKHFTNFPPEFEQYNPEALPVEWDSEENTFDKQGNPHSYNDKPLLILGKAPKKKATGIYALQNYYYSWYKHGKSWRADNKPITILINDQKYATYDKDLKLHSYDDAPAEITWNAKYDELKLVWYIHGVVHREKDLPSIIDRRAKKEVLEKYYWHGVIHRANSLPAEIKPDSKTWMVQKALHNSEGPAFVGKHSFEKEDNCRWGLYGVILYEELFDEVKSCERETGAPLWAAFLTTLGFLTKEDLIMFMQEFDLENTSIPKTWVLRVWGITSETFDTKIGQSNEKGVGYWGLSLSSTRIEDLLNIIKFEEEEKKKLSNA